MRRYELTGALVLASVSLLPISPSAAQERREPPPAAQPPSRTVEELVAKLEDPARREQLIRDLKTLLEAGRATAPLPPAPRGGISGRLVGLFGGISTRIHDTTVQLIEELGRLPAAWRARVQTLGEGETRRALLRESLPLVAALLAGGLAWFLCWWLLRGLRARAVHPGQPGRFFFRALRLATATLLALAPPATFIAVSFAGLTLASVPPASRLAASLVIWAVALKRFATIFLDAVLAPDAPHLRLLPLGDEPARALARDLRRFAGLAIYGVFLLHALAALGAGPALIEPLQHLLGLVLLLAGIAFVLRQRARVMQWLDRRPVAAARPAWRAPIHSLLGLWWVVAILYLAALWLIWAGGVQEGFSYALRGSAFTALAVVVGMIAAAAFRWLVGRMYAGTEPLRRRFPELRESLPRYFAGLRVTGQAAIAVLVVCFSLEAWGVKAIQALGSQAAREVFSVLLGLLLIGLGAMAILDFTTVLTQRYLDARVRESRASGKMRTLVPLARKAVKVIVVTVAIMTALGQLGVQIGPILAGVGVLGLAIGFGAQTLVKDVITGVFILLEDTLAVGDVAVVAGTGGLVEAVDLRTVRLRDLSGNVHTIPWSSIGTVTNMTKDFSYWVIEIGVAYGEDVDEVLQVIREVAEEVRQDPGYQRDVLEPVELLGLERFADSSVVVKARIKTKPIQQWRIGREFNRRLKKAFDARGIEFPFPSRTLWFGERKEGVAPPLRVSRAEPGKGATPPAGKAARA